MLAIGINSVRCTLAKRYWWSAISSHAGSGAKPHVVWTMCSAKTKSALTRNVNVLK